MIDQTRTFVIELEPNSNWTFQLWSDTILTEVCNWQAMLSQYEMLFLRGNYITYNYVIAHRLWQFRKKNKVWNISNYNFEKLRIKKPQKFWKAQKARKARKAWKARKARIARTSRKARRARKARKPQKLERLKLEKRINRLKI